MPRFLIDVNLPRYFSLWNSDEYEHVRDLNDQWTDRQVWEYARQENLVIVSKDADFSDIAMLTEPPPRVIHVRLGNMRMREFHAALSKSWPWVSDNISRFKLIRIFADRIEAVEGNS